MNGTKVKATWTKILKQKPHYKWWSWKSFELSRCQLYITHRKYYMVSSNSANTYISCLYCFIWMSMSWAWPFQYALFFFFWKKKSFCCDISTHTAQCYRFLLFSVWVSQYDVCFFYWKSKRWLKIHNRNCHNSKTENQE